ncbi:energy transducer TonB [Rhodoferax saidenbachensis]|uniref:TonB family protein n=1 Tax=Rhodoferax saidenbachensis TaxID=1484693 RepID=A0ABU1ZTG0_9BURK|nr:energy transducer TonB [Rhodoferax saidenbachensis]MDR7308834.1 TonB family protein [Rhodoferax saidenbachensis]
MTTAVLIVGTCAIHAEQAPDAAQEIALKEAALPNTCRNGYPLLSKRLGEKGQVMLTWRVDADGVPGEAKVVVSSGFQRLDDAAIQIVTSCRYPARSDGAIRVGKGPINFMLP